jgi:hypothetical protein
MPGGVYAAPPRLVNRPDLLQTGKPQARNQTMELSQTASDGLHLRSDRRADS